jgi:septum site-determining protein MinD
VISSIQKKFDFVLVDGPAGIEKNVLAAIAACEETLLVTVPDSPSIADVLKTKIVSQRLGNRPIGVVINMVRGDKGEIARDDISKMLELPVFATVPYDEEVRKSFLYEKVQPVVLRQPNSKAAVEIQKIAAKLAGIPVKESEPVRRRQGGLGIMRFFRNLFRFGKKKEDTLQELEFEQ